MRSCCSSRGRIGGCTICSSATMTPVSVENGEAVLAAGVEGMA